MTDERPADLRLVPVAAGCWLGAAGGLVLAVQAPAWGGAAAAVSGAAATGAGLAVRARPTAPRRELVRGVAVVLAAVAVGLLVAALRVAPLQPEAVLAVAARDGVAQVEAVVAGDPVPLGEQVRGLRRTGPAARVRLVVTRVRAAGLDVTAAMPSTLVCGGIDGWLPGTAVSGLATLHPGDLLRGTSLRLGCRAPFAVTGEPPVLHRVAGRWREGLAEAAGAWPGEGAGLLPGLVIGDTRAVPEDLVAAMRASGPVSYTHRRCRRRG